MIPKVYIYHAGSWYPLAGQTVRHAGSWHQLNWYDKLRHGGIWYPLGADPGPVVPPYTSDEYGWFPRAVGLRQYECTADTTEDPVTGETTYSNWRWELINDEIAAHAPGLENPAEYPQWRYYTLRPTQDFSVEVNTSTGYIIGYGSDLHKPQGSAPPPPAAGLDYYLDMVTYIFATNPQQ